jgi:hypothetical protein
VKYYSKPASSNIHVQDYIVNFMGVEAMIASMNTTFSAQFNQQAFAPYKVNGLLAGQFKTAGTL